MSKKIAIIGSGFSGLALAWHLLDSHEVTLFTKREEASRIAAGIMHKYMGLHAKLNPLAIEAERASLELIQEMTPYASSPLVLNKGIIRVAMTAMQQKSYAECAARYPDVQWLENCQSLDPHLSCFPGIFIESGVTIDAINYLEALEAGCKDKGLLQIEQTINHLDELESFDHVILASGAGTHALLPAAPPLHQLKGQLLEIAWPKHLPILPHTLISQVYLAMAGDTNRAVIGATYEHAFETADPDPELAINELLPKALQLYPELEGCHVLDVKAQIRITTPNRQPYAQILSAKTSLLTGMGSRGLLYHAYYAKQLSCAIMQETARDHCK